jgi:PilZ domain-containing protein
VSQEHREHPRYAHETAVTLYAGDGSVHRGRSDNLSRGGLCAVIDALPAPLATGADVEVDIQLVFDEATTSEPLRLPARIVWCTPVDDTHQIGLAFKPLDAHRTEYLTMFLRFLDDGTKTTRSKRESTLDKRFG